MIPLSFTVAHGLRTLAQQVDWQNPVSVATFKLHAGNLVMTWYRGLALEQYEALIERVRQTGSQIDWRAVYSLEYFEYHCCLTLELWQWKPMEQVQSNAPQDQQAA